MDDDVYLKDTNISVNLYGLKSLNPNKEGHLS